MKRRVYTILDNCYTLKAPACQIVKSYSKKVKEDCHYMAQTAAALGIPSLSAGQVGNEYQMFIILNKAKLVPQKWKGYKVDVKDYDIYTNPTIVKHSVAMVDSSEQCVSLPGLICKCSRHQTILAGWSNQKNKEQQRQISGFLSTLWQHQMDHVAGKLITERRLCNGQIYPTEQLKREMSDRQQYQLHRLRENYKQLVGQDVQGQDTQDINQKRIVQSYQLLLQEIKYGIVQKALEAK